MNTHWQIVQNLYSFFQFLGGNKNVVVQNNGAYKWIRHSASGWPEFVFDINLDDNNPNQILKEITNDKNLPPYVIFDDNQVEKYDVLITKYRFVPVAVWPCLAMKSEDVKDGDYIEKRPLIEILPVQNETELLKWINIAEQGFGKLEFSMFRNCLESNKFQFFIATYESVNASSAVIYYNNDIAGIYHVVTKPEFRKMGIGSQMFKHCQTAAVNTGAELIIAQATNISVNTWLNTNMKQYGNFYLFYKYDN